MISLAPTTGTMAARWFENLRMGIPASIVFSVDIRLAPFVFDGESVRTSARLDFIRLPIASWAESAFREFTFPVNPEDGYIDGTLLLANAHNPVDIVRIRLGATRNGIVPASFDGTVDFTVEGPEELGVVGIDWNDVPLHVDEQALSRVFGRA